MTFICHSHPGDGGSDTIKATLICTRNSKGKVAERPIDIPLHTALFSSTLAIVLKITSYQLTHLPFSFNHNALCSDSCLLRGSR